MLSKLTSRKFLVAVLAFGWLMVAHDTTHAWMIAAGYLGIEGTPDAAHRLIASARGTTPETAP